VGPEKSRGLSPHASDEDLVTTLLLRFSDLSFFKKFTDHFFPFEVVRFSNIKHLRVEY